MNRAERRKFERAAMKDGDINNCALDNLYLEDI